MSVDTTNPRFHWRIIPAWFLMLFGAMLSALSSFEILPILFAPRSAEENILQCSGAALVCAAGICWFAAGRMIFARRWKWMLLLPIVGYGAGVSGRLLIDSSRSSQEDTERPILTSP